MRPRTPLQIFALIAIFIVYIGSGRLQADGIVEWPDGYFKDRKNSNETLVVFVAGLSGEKRWRRFIKLIDSDAEFNHIDYSLLRKYATESSKSLN